MSGKRITFRKKSKKYQTKEKKIYIYTDKYRKKIERKGLKQKWMRTTTKQQENSREREPTQVVRKKTHLLIFLHFVSI